MSELFDEWGVDDDLDEDDLEDEGFDEDDLDDLDLDDDEEEEDDVDEEDDEDDFDLDEEMDSELAGSVEISCPYCGAGVELIVDPVGGEVQEYVEDCEVCCQPWSVRVTLDPDGSPSVEVGTLDDG